MDTATGIRCRISQCDGDDFVRGLWNCSVGEASKRFTSKQVDDGTAWGWMQSVIDLIGKHGGRQ